jgi:SAM-dependent methyltransferase
MSMVTDAADRFRFGENWRSYSALIGGDQIAEAELSLKRLLQRDDLTRRRLLDVGCGSGLFSLASRNLGASVFSFDFDRDAADCARALKARYRANDREWAIEQGSILDREYLGRLGHFDVVYAWGVLHHTGDMHQAIRNAASLVAEDGLLVMALYGKTPFCGLWAAEKRWYSRASPSMQKAARAVYVVARRASFLLRGRDFSRYVAEYQRRTRGMDFHHDVHDWLGGYPYESISPSELLALAGDLSFNCVRSNCRRRPIGLFGSGCDEYVLQRIRRM